MGGAAHGQRPAAHRLDTAVSFTTDTNWQNYSGESTMTYLVQMGGLAVQNFMSAAVGLVIAIAMIRGFTRSRTGTLGNFWPTSPTPWCRCCSRWPSSEG